LGAASNLLFNLWLIPLYGMRGAAFATLLSYILMVAASYILSQSMYRVSYPIQKVFVLILICILALLAGGSLNFLQKVLVTTLCLCAMVLFTVRWERLHIY
jgi:O-antigen/teichoic acid export membrane protein